MQFDIEGARKEGYSDAEIAEYLGSQSQFDVKGARENGYNDAEIIAHLVGQPQGMSWGEAIGQAPANIPSSGVRLAKNLAQAAMHPIDTLDGVVRIGAGAMETALPGNSGLPTGNKEKYEAFKQAMAERYGSMDAVKNTLATDPVGMFADIAGLLAGGGGLMRGAGTMANMPRVAQAGATAAKVGGLIDPVNVARQAVTAPLRALPESLPARLWSSAVKPNSKQFPSQAAQAELFNTAVENNIPLSIRGKERLTELMRGVNADIEGVVNTGAARGDTIDPYSVAARVDELRPYYENQAVPSQFTGKLDDVQIGFVNEHPQPIPVDRAQQMKRDIYHENRKKYGETRTAGDEAEKAIARGLKEELATLYPELDGMNEKFSKYIDLDGAITDALQRIGKHQLLGLTSGMWGGAGYMAGGPAGMAGSMLSKLVMDSQPVKSRVALALAAAKRYPELTTKGAGKRAVAANVQRTEGEE